jgi:OmcA/MtrC family decaheme c-type cytochrome
MYSVVLVAAIVTMAHREAAGQAVPLGWEATQYFKYNIENVVVVNQPTLTTPGTLAIAFSVTDPTNGNTPWNIKAVGPFKCSEPTDSTLVCPSPGPSPSLMIDIGHNTTEYVNTGSRFDPVSGGFSLNPVFVNATSNPGLGAAFPIRINALRDAKSCTTTPDPWGVCSGLPSGRFWVSSPLPPQLIGLVKTGVIGTGVVGMEGHPVWPATGTATHNVPVKSVVKPFPITDTTAQPRRQIVDFDTKCSKCHDGLLHDGREIPRLALHGGNRNEEPALCVICHNPNQTDIPYRTLASPPSTDPLGSGVAPEVSVDFKRMTHAIHAGGFRTKSYTVVGRNGTIVDFSGVRFPATLSNCLNCHVDVGGKGTFELPLLSTVLGSTVKTGSTIGATVDKMVDLDPTNNLRITPIASVCSSCHDKAEVRSHMVKQGARFGVLQSDIDAKVRDRLGVVSERCAFCHGPGKDKDVRKVHEIGTEEHEEEHDD